MPLYVAYYRVSTDKQGISGLGMDAQKEAVARFIAGGDLIAEFVEVESGRKSNRPQLLAALDMCRKSKAVLVIARLDRLARNVAFIANLGEFKQTTEMFHRILNNGAAVEPTRKTFVYLAVKKPFGLAQKSTRKLIEKIKTRFNAPILIF